MIQNISPYPRICKDERALIERCREARFRVPEVFGTWPDHFSTRRQFLLAFETWLETKLAQPTLLHAITTSYGTVVFDYPAAVEKEAAPSGNANWEPPEDYGYGEAADWITNKWTFNPTAHAQRCHKTTNPTVAAPSGHSRAEHFVI